MAGDVPPEVAAILDGADPAARDGAWSRFLRQYHRLFLKAAGAAGDYDTRMDRYRYVVEQLAAEDFRRLRAYRPRSGASFAAWLSVVARRLCVDFERTRFGRSDRHQPGALAEEERLGRRRLATLAGSHPDPARLADGRAGPERLVREAELHQRVVAALETLAPRERLLVRLRFEDGLSVRQIAAVMGYPTVFHVYRALRPVLARLKERLVEQGVTDGSA
jgi:RNA polymerase sigma factor (sigma-70 family)